LLVLTNEERIALHLLLHNRDFLHMINELLHLFLISKIEGSKGYLLKDFEEVNSDHHKMGDIYVPSKECKYEVKSFDKLGGFRIKKILAQYGRNNFILNNMHFSIVFQDVLPNFSIESFREELSSQLGIPRKNINLCSTKEMREEIGDIKGIFSQYYSLQYKDYLREQKSIFVKTISDLSLQLKDEKKRKQTEELLKGLENPLNIKDKYV
jgi:hypothetical protein